MLHVGRRPAARDRKPLHAVQRSGAGLPAVRPAREAFIGRRRQGCVDQLRRLTRNNPPTTSATTTSAPSTSPATPIPISPRTSLCLASSGRFIGTGVAGTCMSRCTVVRVELLGLLPVLVVPGFRRVASAGADAAERSGVPAGSASAVPAPSSGAPESNIQSARVGLVLAMIFSWFFEAQPSRERSRELASPGLEQRP